MKIALFDVKPYDREFFERWNKKYNASITYFEERLSVNNAVLTKYYDVVCVFVNDDVNEKVLSILSKNGIRLLALRSAGYNNVDFKAAKKYGIRVVRVPAYSPYAVAEHALALIMTLNRKIHKAYSRTRDGNFTLNGLLGTDLHGKTAGIIGTGRIAKILIGILKGLGMNVLGYDKFPDEKAAKEIGYTYVTLDELYKESDIISLHCPLTPETMYLINYNSIKKMKDGVMIINTGRGKLIDTSMLIEGLKDKKISAAGLDVYEEEESYFFEDDSADVLQDDVLARLLTFNNVIVTSHQAFFTREALDGIVETTFNNILEYHNKQELTNEVYYDEKENRIVEGNLQKH